MTVPRTKGLCNKVTEEEYATFERLADGETLSEWVRNMLLKATATPPADPVVLAELRAFRSIVLNLLFKIANGKPVTADVMKGVLAQADGERVRRVHERLAPPTGARDE
jgi:putative stress-induced transcription regulator